MHIVVRRAIFYFFVALFLVSAPVIVLYTAGFRYNMENGQLVRTGVLEISSLPRNASIFLNDRGLEKTTPYVAKYLLPGTYDVSLKRTGYHTWTNQVDIYAGETTTAEEIYLFRDEVPTLALEAAPDFLSGSPNDTSIAYQIEENGWSELWLYELDSGLARLIDRFVVSSAQTVVLSWSVQGGFLLAQNQDDQSVRVYEADGQAVAIPEALLTNLTTAFFHPSDDQLLYLATEDALTQYDLQTGSTKTFDNTNVATVLIDASLLVFVDNGTHVELRQVIDDEYSVLALLPEADYHVHMRDAGFVLLLDENDTLFLIDMNAERPILLQTTVSAFDWHEGNDELLYTDGNEVHVYNPHSHTFRFITREGSPIDGLAWHASGAVILVNTNNNLLAFEKQQIGKSRVVTTLGTNLTIDQFWTTKDGKFVYFYGSINDVTGLYALRLMR